MLGRLSIFLAIASVAAPALAQDTDRSDWPASLVIGTGSPGATYAIYGQGLASLISNHVGIPTSTQQTQGPYQNVTLVQHGKIDIALTTMGPAYEAWSGESDLAPGLEHDQIRAIAPMYISPFQMAALASSGLDELSDLQGRRVGLGPAGGSGGYWTKWFEALDISIEASYGPFGDQMGQLADRRLDAVGAAPGIPAAAYTELETMEPAHFFAFPDEAIAQLTAEYPFLQPTEIPAGTYPSLKEPLQTIGMWNFMLTNADLSDSLIYEITKAIYEHHDELVASHGSARESLAENMVQNRFLPVHPGAARYYAEAGITLPDTGN
ncbi:C4-dicarboxylate ABC transporter substrate-binding protein [Ochrobactrum sp. POC9]|uniref:TAXI family TRAP transporter solute-binding subunit n=1 Tax=Ochrobactrum sp. POC9 TaxID=2203419 RepID=UPI000D708080|nr:TAXI family TRAP transporter solute-binding subunit [Ochrobactrum sp. POC9]PWU71089.1 C4-dicarboxylate ABC transporter substrate-binding protein [Ochrobactrum sp. POC9]